MKYRDANPDEAKFFWSGGPVRVAERTWFQSMISGVTGFETDEGLVLVDTGHPTSPLSMPASPALAGQLRKLTSSSVHTAIYTHGHQDHAFGLDAFLVANQRRPRVVAHRAILSRFERYERTRAHNRTINARQFSAVVSGANTGSIFDITGTPSILPETIYDDRLTLKVGGVTFELHHCKGETDDATWVWSPEREVLCTGDLFIWAVPNAGNPLKVQRYPREWAKGLRQMAAIEPSSLCPGHGGPVVNDPDKIQRMLLETADYLDAIVEQTLDALENGSPPHTDILNQVKLPLSSSPWLQPSYDDPEFIVRNLIREYGGWWNGRPSELKPAPRIALATEIVALAGGVERLAGRSKQLADEGDIQLACHLADYALEAAPKSPEAQRVVTEIYGRRAETETSLIASNLFRSAAAYAREGRPFV